MKRIQTENKTKEELLNNLHELRSKLDKLVFDHAEKKLNNPMELQAVKKDIARLLTAINNQ
ncbi:MAG TPA: 50S ribosomal protein L29 [Candidatus Paceibacterota bacterium]|nr:50S ribosomal protein L29 [Candidatus Paceibacterota bacterium]